jgi:hypothetical protein
VPQADITNNHRARGYGGLEGLQDLAISLQQIIRDFDITRLVGNRGGKVGARLDFSVAVVW